MHNSATGFVRTGQARVDPFTLTLFSSIDHVTLCVGHGGGLDDGADQRDGTRSCCNARTCTGTTQQPPRSRRMHPPIGSDLDYVSLAVSVKEALSQVSTSHQSSLFDRPNEFSNGSCRHACNRARTAYILTLYSDILISQPERLLTGQIIYLFVDTHVPGLDVFCVKPSLSSTLGGRTTRATFLPRSGPLATEGDTNSTRLAPP